MGPTLLRCVRTRNNIRKHGLEAAKVYAAGVFQVMGHALDPRVTHLRINPLKVPETMRVEVDVHYRQRKLGLFERCMAKIIRSKSIISLRNQI